MGTKTDFSAYSVLLLAWYNRHGRVLPWRSKQPDPYSVWVSEIMLQQTTVSTVLDYYKAFIKKWPDLDALSKASLNDILYLWQGLGYYGRARNLHKAAQILVHDYGGVFPQTKKDLLNLPGIGDYTASVMAAIIFGQAEAVIDGNVSRVISRLFALETPLPAVLKQVRDYTQQLTPDNRPGDYAQAMMDLGAMICKPRLAECSSCPLSRLCRGKNQAESFPHRLKKPPKPTRRAVVFFLENQKDWLLCQKRPESGLLAGTYEFPSSEWLKQDMPDFMGISPPDRKHVGWVRLGKITHIFTHFRLELDIFTKKNLSRTHDIFDGFWVSLEKIDQLAFSNLMRKALALFLANKHQG